jgi:ABC-type multidrug transport system ATPase subunit
LELSGVGRDEAVRRIQTLSEIYELSESLHVRADALSTGTRKRLGIAIALAVPAAIYLLDEPSGGLDAHGVNVLLGTVRMLRRRGLTVLVTSHAPELFVHLADSLWRIEPGAQGATLVADSNGGHDGPRGDSPAGRNRDHDGSAVQVELPWFPQR